MKINHCNEKMYLQSKRKIKNNLITDKINSKGNVSLRMESYHKAVSRKKVFCCLNMPGKIRLLL